MFRRALEDLCRYVKQKNSSDIVELYYRCFFEKKIWCGKSHQGVRALTRIRWQKQGKEWTLSVGGLLPSTATLAVLMDNCRPGEIQTPVLTTARKQHTSIQRNITDESNWNGYFREFLITSEGMCLTVDGHFSMYVDDHGIWLEKPLLQHLDRGSAVIIPPHIVSQLLLKGYSVKSVQRSCAGSFFHNFFDGIGGTDWQWGRTPDAMNLYCGSLSLMNAETGNARGVICHQAFPIDGRMSLLAEDGTKICTVNESVLESVNRVSKDYLFYQNGLVFRMPFLKIEGDI